MLFLQIYDDIGLSFSQFKRLFRSHKSKGKWLLDFELDIFLTFCQHQENIFPHKFPKNIFFVCGRPRAITRGCEIFVQLVFHESFASDRCLFAQVGKLTPSMLNQQNALVSDFQFRGIEFEAKWLSAVGISRITALAHCCCYCEKNRAVTQLELLN